MEATRKLVAGFCKDELQPYYEAGLLDARRFAATIYAVVGRFMQTVPDTELSANELSSRQRSEIVQLIKEVLNDKQKLLKWICSSPTDQLEGRLQDDDPSSHTRDAPSVTRTLSSYEDTERDSTPTRLSPPRASADTHLRRSGGRDTEEVIRLASALESANLVIASLHMKVSQLNEEIYQLKEGRQFARELEQARERVVQLEYTLRTHDEWCMFAPANAKTSSAHRNKEPGPLYLGKVLNDDNPLPYIGPPINARLAAGIEHMTNPKNDVAASPKAFAGPSRAHGPPAASHFKPFELLPRRKTTYLDWETSKQYMTPATGSANYSPPRQTALPRSASLPRATMLGAAQQDRFATSLPSHMAAYLQGAAQERGGPPSVQSFAHSSISGEPISPE